MAISRTRDRSNKNEDSIAKRKVVFDGDVGSGKTSLVDALCGNAFSEDKHLPTVLGPVDVQANANSTPVTLALTDMVLMEHTERARRIYYWNADVIAVCYSVGNPDSFQSAKDEYWLSAKALAPGGTLILVALKTDLRDDAETVEWLAKANQAPITAAQGQQLAEAIGAVSYVECSVLSGTSVSEVLEAIASAAMAE
ncbi:GTP-binding protein Rho1, partial [Dipsacomyces acuminosporus]